MRKKKQQNQWGTSVDYSGVSQVCCDQTATKLPDVYKFPTEWMHSKHISVFLSFFMFFSPDYKTELSFFLKKVENFQPLQKKKSLVFPSARNRHCSQFSFYFLFPMHTNVSECTYRYWQCAKYISLYTNYVEQKVFFFFFWFFKPCKAGTF